MISEIEERPSIPHEIFNLSLEDAYLTYDAECDAIWKEVLEEFFDPEHSSRSHHSVGTYNSGCRGPLCRKALREHPRRRSPISSIRQLREERIFDPVMEYFHMVLKYRVRYVQQKVLKDLKEGESANG